MTAAVRPARRWSVALAAALIAHGLIAAWLWPRAPQPDAAGAAPAAILIELPAPSPPPPASTTPSTTTAAAAPRASEPEPARRPAPAPQPRRTEAPRAIERPAQQHAATDTAPAPPARESAPATPAPDEAGATATPSQPESTVASTSGSTADASAATATAQHGSAQGRPAAEATWQSRLLGHLEGFRRYPTRALRQRHEGVTYLRFSVDRRGGIGTVRLERSSGSDLLDAEALEVVRRAQPVPPPPREIEGDPVEVVVPVQFRLRRR